MPNTSPNMNLIVPIPSNGTTGTGDPGPLYAQEISNDLLVTIDQHDHSPGKGVPITAAGLNLNTDVNINSNNLTAIRSTRYSSQATAINGVGDESSTYVSNGNLYYNNSAGQSIQLTSGNSLVAATSNNVLGYQQVVGDWLILSTDSYIWLNVATNAPRVITLPAANSVAQGRWYVISDYSGLAATNNITINAVGSDSIVGQGSATINVNGGWLILGSNGNNEWSILSASTVVPPNPISSNYFQAGIGGATGNNYAHVASGLGGAQGQLVQWNQPMIQIGDIYQATAVGTGAGWIYFNAAGTYEINYTIVATGLQLANGGSFNPAYVHQELNSPNFIGQGTAIAASFSILNAFTPNAGYLPNPMAQKDYIMTVPSGVSLETWIVPNNNTPNPTGVQISPTGTLITIKQIA